MAGSRRADTGQAQVEDLWFWRERVFFVVFLVMLTVGLVSLIPTLIETVRGGLWLTAVQYGLVYAFTCVIIFCWRIPYKIRAMLGLMLLYYIGVLTLDVIGLYGSGRIWLFAFCLLSAAFLGLRYGLLALVISLATMRAFVVFAPEKARLWDALYHQAGHEAIWNIATCTLILLSAMAVLSLAVLLKSLELSLERARGLQAELEKQSSRLSQANDELTCEVRERRAAERALRASEERHRLLLEASPNPIVMLDAQGLISYANPAFDAAFGPCLGQDERRRLPFALLPDLVAQAMDPDEADSGDVSAANVLVRGANGQPLEIEVRHAPLPGPDGALLGRVVVLHDVSQHRQAERERVAREKLQAAVETAGAACHELNQPLQTILLQAELLLDDMADGPLSAESGLRGILASAKRMAGITLELNRLAEYHTKQYVGKSKILDLRRSTADQGREA